MRVGVVGAGFIGRLHALNLKADPRVDLVGVADTVPAAAQRLAGEVGTKALPGLAALLDAGVVYVTTPNTHHVEPVLAALAHGAHVFSEKPMATSLDGALRIRRAAEGARRLSDRLQPAVRQRLRLRAGAHRRRAAAPDRGAAEAQSGRTA